MRGKLVILVILTITIGFCYFWNANKIVRQTQELDGLEKTYAAQKNINTELRVELDDLRSGKHIASLVRVELSNFVPQEEQGKIIYVHEPSGSDDKGNYCIIDLFTSKAQAKEVQILLD